MKKYELFSPCSDICLFEMDYDKIQYGNFIECTTENKFSKLRALVQAKHAILIKYKEKYNDTK